MTTIIRAGLTAVLLGFCSVATAQGYMPAGMHVHMLHNVHVAGKILMAGKSNGDDGKMHLLVGVKLEHPLKNGVKTVAATITHKEPSQKVQISMGIHSGEVSDVGSVDVTCPRIRVLSYKGKVNAFGEECTLNSYKL